MHMMPEYFTTGSTIDVLLFNGLKISSILGLVCACIVIGLATFCLEGSRVLFLYFEARVRQHPLTYGLTDTQQSDTAPLFSSLSIPSSLESIRKRRVKYHCLAFLAHTCNVLLAFLIMLAVMSYNAWIGGSVLIGAGLGHFVFGTWKVTIQQKYSTVAPAFPSNSNSTVQINTPTENPDLDFSGM